MCRSSRAIVPGASAASPDSAGCARFRRNRFLMAAKPARNGSRLSHGAWSILPRDRSFCVMTDQYQSHFDGITARAAASRRDRFVVGLLLGLILGGGLTLLWTINRSAPRATKDLQTTEQKIAGQLQSLQQTLASNQAETKQALTSGQAETKRLSDQVTALSSKLDALQQSFASAQRSPASSEPPPAPAKRRR